MSIDAEAFRREGFVVLDGFFNEQEAAAMKVGPAREHNAAAAARPFAIMAI